MLYGKQLPNKDEAIQILRLYKQTIPKSLVFEAMPCTSTINRDLKVWAKKAGVDKNICFHISRHTFATMALTLGADICTTSKLLGHTNVRTTQIYAEIISEKKRRAINLFDEMT